MHMTCCSKLFSTRYKTYNDALLSVSAEDMSSDPMDYTVYAIFQERILE